MENFKFYANENLKYDVQATENTCTGSKLNSIPESATNNKKRRNFFSCPEIYCMYSYTWRKCNIDSDYKQGHKPHSTNKCMLPI